MYTRGEDRVSKPEYCPTVTRAHERGRVSVEDVSVGSATQLITYIGKVGNTHPDIPPLLPYVHPHPSCTRNRSCAKGVGH